MLSYTEILTDDLRVCHIQSVSIKSTIYNNSLSIGVIKKRLK